MVCIDLLTVINGEVTYTPPRSVSANLLDGTRYAGTIATYNCLPGYQLIGSSLRACEADGTWNGTAPSCCKIWDKYPKVNVFLIPLEMNRQNINLAKFNLFLALCNYKVNWPLGYIWFSPLLSGSHAVIACGALANPINGQVDTSSGTTATYTCNTGYILNGTSLRTCGSDGVWSPGVTTCDGE